MAPISTSEINSDCTKTRAVVLGCTHGAELGACDSGPDQVISKAGSPRLPGDSKVAVFRLGQSLKEEHLLSVTRATAREYVDSGVARWTAGGKKLQLLRDPRFTARGASAVMSARTCELAATGSKHHQALVQAWRPKQIDIRPLEPVIPAEGEGDADKSVTPLFAVEKQERTMQRVGNFTTSQRTIIAAYRSQRQPGHSFSASAHGTVRWPPLTGQPPAVRTPVVTMAAAQMRAEYLRLLLAS